MTWIINQKAVIVDYKGNISLRSTVYCLIIDDKYNVHHAYPLCVEERLDYYEHMWDNDDEDNKMLSALD